MEEIWKDIPDYEGYYQVSNIGNVKSLDRFVNSFQGMKKRNGRNLKKSLDTAGYPIVSLSKDHKKRNFTVHSLMTMSFFGKSDLVTDHIDSVRSNNIIENLRYISREENTRRANIKSKHMKGVSKRKRPIKRPWAARINKKGKSFHIGYFETETDAHNAYLIELYKLRQEAGYVGK